MFHNLSGGDRIETVDGRGKTNFGDSTGGCVCVGW